MQEKEKQKNIKISAHEQTPSQKLFLKPSLTLHYQIPALSIYAIIGGVLQVFQIQLLLLPG